MPSDQNIGEAKSRVCVGKISTAHGVKGLVKVQVFAEDIKLLGGQLFTSERGPKTISITLKNAMAKHWLAELEGVSDRDEALALRGTKLYVDRDILPDTQEGEFYLSDLIGLNVQGTDKEKIGIILNVVNFGAGDMLEIQPLSGASFYLPFNDENVPKIDKKSVTISIPEGLLS